MHRYMFTERVKEKFRYLVEEYGFSVADERYDPDAFGNSLVDYQSGKTTIRVLLDRGEVTIGVGPYPLASDCWFDLSRQEEQRRHQKQDNNTRGLVF